MESISKNQIRSVKLQALKHMFIRLVALLIILFLTLMIGVLIFSKTSAGTSNPTLEIEGGIVAKYFMYLLVSEILIWVVILAIEMRKKNRMVRYTNGALLVGVLIVGLFGYNMLFSPQLLYSQSSPCGDYSVDVYAEKSFISMPGQGGVSGTIKNVVVRNGWGWKIADSEVSATDIELEWDCEHYILTYARGQGIYFGK